MAGTSGIETSVSKLLDQYRAQFESALPRHMRIEHFMRCALTYIKKNPTVGKCSAVSICKSLMDAAQLGLAPDGLLGSAYLVPFNNKVKDDQGERWEMTCQLIVGYRGMIDLARRSGQILDIQARPVLADDEFSLDWGKAQPLSHKPNLDANPAEDQGKNVRGVYAIAFYRDGSTHMEYMSRAEIEGIQRRSKANGKGFSPWQTDWVEMARKTVVKRLAKYLPLSPELSRAIEIDNDAQEIVKDADVILPDEKPVSKTDALKARLAHQPIEPVQGELDDALDKRDSAEEAAANIEADKAAARAKLEAPAERKPEPAKEAKAAPKADEPIEPDTLTRDEKLFVRMLGKKQVRAKVAEMSDTDMQDARDAAEATLLDPESDAADKAHAKGAIVLLEDEAVRRVGAKA